MTETVRLVLNRNSEQPYVLHREDCPTIQHQVRGDLRQELPAGGSQFLETYEDGLALVGPNEGTERWYFDAVYVSLEELATVGRYRRCKTCTPDAPDGPPKAQAYLKKASTLTRSDLGRVTVDGTVVRVEHSAAGTVVTLDSGVVLSFGEGETIAFPKPSKGVSQTASTDGSSS
ncbi:hypothetical protein [Microbacterium sp.]|uniref:hypothetical protein n=1 Tax=Microbacterium sp. TaxID=51671 RepID=UPI003340C676